VEANVSLNRIHSFLLCEEHESIPPGSLESNGVEMVNVTAAYESKKPRFLDGVDMDPQMKELADTKWEVSLLKSQLEEAERHIQEVLWQQKIKEQEAQQEIITVKQSAASEINQTRQSATEKINQARQSAATEIAQIRQAAMEEIAQAKKKLAAARARRSGHDSGDEWEDIGYMKEATTDSLDPSPAKKEAALPEKKAESANPPGDEEALRVNQSISIDPSEDDEALLMVKGSQEVEVPVNRPANDIVDVSIVPLPDAMSNPDPEVSPTNLLCLKRVNFQCNEGELVAVVGMVGSGKSTLINSILGEVKRLSGTSAVRGTLSYFSQSPFILNATIRDNILFGHVNDKVIDEALYQRAIECCALRHDLKMLSHGDQTEIGERGVTLSGGQKARVALARSVYHHADISLIDDALSAVDAHVAKHLFHQCIVEELLTEKRSVILVTNALQFLSHPRVDRIVVLSDGRVAEQGSYQELANKPNSLFARFLTVIDETGIKPTVSTDDQSFSSQDDEGSQAEVTMKDEGDLEVTTPVKERVSTTGGASGTPPPRRESVEVQKTMLMTEEARSIGHVGMDVYLSWAVAAGGYWVPVALVLLFGATEGVNVLSKWWLTYWSSHSNSESQNAFLADYALINVVYVVVVFASMVVTTFIALRASQNVSAVSVCLRSPVSVLVIACLTLGICT
jgi:ABC-type multidrug transport system fused ATPase/permease subunit